MVNVTAAMVKQLRDLTGSGIMDCKHALQETDGDMQKAVEVLRKAGKAMAEKKAGRIAAEGLVAFKVSEDEKTAAIVEVNSETDFVARNDTFKAYVAQVADQALKTNARNMEEFKAEPWIPSPSETVQDALVEEVAVIHENLQIRRFAKVVSNSYIGTYLHGGGRIGVLVNVDVQEVNQAVRDCVKNVAMQIAAMNPMYLNEESVDQEFLSKEKEIILGQIEKDAPGKPEAVKEKIAAGKLKKRLNEVVLMDQSYFRADDDKVKISDYLSQVSREVGFPITVKSYVRYETGEGIEKKQENFAEEVSKQLGE